VLEAAELQKNVPDDRVALNHDILLHLNALDVLLPEVRAILRGCAILLSCGAHVQPRRRQIALWYSRLCESTEAVGHRLRVGCAVGVVVS
jgi:hypothetical protein